jgi:uncharacterized membrane protein
LGLKRSLAIYTRHIKDQEKFEYSKGVIKIRKLEKGRSYNYQKGKGQKEK